MSTTRRPAKKPFRLVMREILDPYEGGPDGSRLSLFVDVFVLLCIVGSCLLILFEHLYPAHARLFFVLECVFTSIFVLEYLLRWWVAPNRALYPFGFFAIIDLIAILPTLLMLSSDLLMLRAVRGIRLLRLFRLLRLLRLLKFLRYGHLIYRAVVEFRVWCSAVNYQYRLRELGRLFVYVLLAWIIGANILHLTEKNLVGAEGPFGQYWKSYWHILIVLVSGIEDKEPLSLLGRIEVTLMMIYGICMVGMLTGEIVAILVKKAQRTGKVAIKPPKGRLEQHIVIIGRNEHLDPVIREVYHATHGRNYILLVDPDAEDTRITDAEIYGRVFALAGDPVRPEVLNEAMIDTAFRVIVLASEEEGKAPHLVDDRTLMETLAVYCQQIEVPTVVELRDPDTLLDVRAMQAAGIEFILSKRYGEILISQAVRNPGITEVFDRLMSFSDETNEFYTIDLLPELVGMQFRQAQAHFLARDDDDVVLVGLDRSPAQRPNSVFMLNPCAEHCQVDDDELVLREGDKLVVLAFDRPSFAEASPDDIWSGKVLVRD